MKETGIVYDWSKHKGPTEPVRLPSASVEIDDETLRDGMQGTQFENQEEISPDANKQYIQIAAPFIDHADSGFPGSHENHRDRIKDVIRNSLTKGLGTTFSCAARGSAMEDIRPIIEISHQLDGYPLEADIFLDSSTYRAKAQGWDREEMLLRLKDNILLLKQHNLPIMFVAERATATPPDELHDALKMAADLGVDRLCIADTQGRADHRGVVNIFRWSFVNFSNYENIKWDGHFHNDLGLGAANSLAAVYEGANRVHATVIGIGERSGNVDLATMLVALQTRGFIDKNLQGLTEFYKKASEMFKLSIPVNLPAVGDSSHGTSSGVHASAIESEQNEQVAENIYFAYPPELVGARAKVEIGPMSGGANVRLKLRDLGIPSCQELEIELLKHAKEKGVILNDDTIRADAIPYITKL